MCMFRIDFLYYIFLVVVAVPNLLELLDVALRMAMLFRATSGTC